RASVGGPPRRPPRGGRQPRHFDHQAAQPDHAAVDLRRIEFVDLLREGLHVGGGGLILPATKSSPLTLTSRLPGSLIIASPSLGTRVSPARTEGASRPNRLLPILKVDYEH